MPSKDNPKNEEQVSQSPESRQASDMHKGIKRLVGHFWRLSPESRQASDMHKVMIALEEVFSTIRSQLRDDVPKPFTGDAKIAVDVFNDIVAGLRLESRPKAIKIEAKQLSPTEIDLTWTDAIG